MASLFDSSNFFSSSNVGNGGVVMGDSGGGGSRIGGQVVGREGVSSATDPITKKTKTQTDVQTDKTATSNLSSAKTGATQKVADEVRDLQTVTDPVLQALEQAIAGLNQNATLQTTDQGRQQNIQAILNAIQNFDAEEIKQGAEGDVAQLNRELLEDVLPQVTGAVEAGGSSNNALAALLAQDAASRTSEAGARVREQARSNSANEFINMINAATGAAGGGSATTDALTGLINAAKGTVEQGGVTGVESTTSQETGTAQGVETESGTTATRGQENITDASVLDSINSSAGNNRLAALALLQSSLSPFQTLQDLTYRPGAGATGPGAAARRDSAASVQRLASLLGI